MNNEIVFRFLLLLLFGSFVAHRAYYTRKFGSSEQDSVTEREGGTWASTVANLLSVFALISTAIYLIYPNWMTWASLPLSAWLRWVGVGVALLGFALLQWSHDALGKNWSDTPRQFLDAGPAVGWACTPKLLARCSCTWRQKVRPSAWAWPRANVVTMSCAG